MSTDRLIVRHFGRDVGTITREPSGALMFEYTASWLAAETGFALATSLPLTDDAHGTSFFRNLLPEGGPRERIARSAGISPDNDFAFLRIFGADCAGSWRSPTPMRRRGRAPAPAFSHSPPETEHGWRRRKGSRASGCRRTVSASHSPGHKTNWR